jgi:TRAP-type C4-dicarboxylate transport system substrate-binding protein
MASESQRAAARSNVKKAQAAAKRKQTLKHLPAETRTALGREANKVRTRQAKTRRELEAEARRLDIRGRSKMGKDELRRAISRAS